MSRLRVGHGPDAWLLEDPRPAHVRQRPFSVQAENVGNMNPVLKGWVLSDERRAQNAEAQRKRRERVG